VAVDLGERLLDQRVDRRLVALGGERPQRGVRRGRDLGEVGAQAEVVLRRRVAGRAQVLACTVVGAVGELAQHRSSALGRAGFGPAAQDRAVAGSLGLGMDDHHRVVAEQDRVAAHLARACGDARVVLEL
jgi:hypothetical protein